MLTCLGFGLDSKGNEVLTKLNNDRNCGGKVRALLGRVSKKHALERRESNLSAVYGRNQEFYKSNEIS